jgi:hypothetical protein
MRRLSARRKRRELELRPDVQIGVMELRQMILDETGDKEAADTAASDYLAAITKAGRPAH